MTSESKSANQAGAQGGPVASGQSAAVNVSASDRAALNGLPFRQPPAPSSDWLLHGFEPGEGQPLVLMHQTAILQVLAHSRSNLGCELGGALLGHAYRHQNSVIVEVKAALPATSSDHGPVHFTFSADSWSKLHRDRATFYSSLDIIGWFHTHPDLGVFYSSDDVIVHSAAFTQPWHVGLVVDPVREEAAWFGWVDGELSPLDGYYEFPERQPESQAPWRPVRTSVWNHPYEAEQAGQPSQVVLARNSHLRFSPRELGVAMSTAALALSFFLIFGAILPMKNRINLLETTVLNLAQTSLKESNSLSCPDPRLRIIVPLADQSYAVGAPVQIIGTADYPDARRYQLDIRPTGGGQWSVIGRMNQESRFGELGVWDTTGLPAGSYDLRLSPVDANNIRLTDSNLCILSLNLIASTSRQ